MHHQINFILLLFCTSVIYAQDIHVDGDILLNNSDNRKISVEESPLNNNTFGKNLTIQAGNISGDQSIGGSLYLFGGDSDISEPGIGGSIFLRPGIGQGTGSIKIQSASGTTIANFNSFGSFLTLGSFSGLVSLGGSSVVGSGGEAAYRQLEFVNPDNGNYKWILGPQSSTPSATDNDFFFYVDRGPTHLAGWIQDNNVAVRMNFTGQHRSLIKGIDFTDPNLEAEDLSGLIVVADQNEYMSMSGGLNVGQDAIMIDESLPVLSLSSQAKDKRVFGVISGIEEKSRNDAYGAFTTPYEKEEGDQRVFVNSLGEGGIWVIDEAGELSSGDYIITSNVPGYGMRQDKEFLANYTVAKITMDCNFDPKVIPKRKIKKDKIIIKEQVTYQNVLDDMGRLTWEQTCNKEGKPMFEASYKMRYLLPNGNQISKQDYELKKSNGEEVYRAAFVGCTYHCG